MATVSKSSGVYDRWVPVYDVFFPTKLSPSQRPFLLPVCLHFYKPPFIAFLDSFPGVQVDWKIDSLFISSASVFASFRFRPRNFLFSCESDSSEFYFLTEYFAFCSHAAGKLRQVLSLILFFFISSDYIIIFSIIFLSLFKNLEPHFVHNCLVRTFLFYLKIL